MTGTDVGGEPDPAGDRLSVDPLATRRLPAADGGAAAGAGVGHGMEGATGNGPAVDRAAGSEATAARSAQGDLDDEAAPGASRQNRSFVRELPFLIVVALVLALVIKALLVQAFYIPSESMQQTLQERDRVLVNKLVYRFRDVRRGEVVVFDGKGSFTSPYSTSEPAGGPVERALRSVARAVGVGASDEKDFIKRVIGIEGDRVACCTDGGVTVQPRGAERAVRLTEPYVHSVSGDTEPFCAAGLGAQNCPAGAPGVQVPPGRIWVMGDHRDASQDSRAYMDNDDSGTVSVDEVVGRAFVIVWPLDRARLLGVPSTFDRLRDDAPSAVGVGAGVSAGSGVGAAVSRTAAARGPAVRAGRSCPVRRRDLTHRQRRGGGASTGT